MVVFTCNHCGESLQKPRVEKHYAFVCRRVKFLTCVDCFKDFREEEYVTHTKCVTEEERYAAKGSMPNGVVKKGELKQESWVDMIKSIIDKEHNNLKPSQRNLLETISNYSNIPRKKPKFFNFIKSSSGGRVNMKDVEDIWNIIEKYKINKSSQINNTQNGSNGTSTKTQNPNLEENPHKRKKDKTIIVEQEEPKKKRRKDLNNENEVTDNQVDVTNGQELPKAEKFNFQSKILSVLESKGTISLKKLEKKVVNAYLKHSGESEATPKIIKKFNKKFKKISNVELTDDNVSLKQV